MSAHALARTLVCALVCAPLHAAAQSVTGVSTGESALAPVTTTAAPLSPEVAPRPPRRVVGFGGGVGIGLEGTSANTTRVAALAPTLEVRVAITPRIELAVWVPLVNLAFSNHGYDTTFAWFDVMATWYPLRDGGGFFVAPGLGFVYGASSSASGVGLQVPVRIGWEWSTSARGVGFSMDLRPWAELVIPAGNVDVGARGGVFFELNLIGYVTRAPSPGR
ncbi:MAG: hypothetical protein WCJ30_07535 [Deltaproteobacteria bacterium]